MIYSSIVKIYWFRKIHNDRYPLCGKQRHKEMADKIKFPYNLQPIDKYLRQAESNFSLGTPYCLNANDLLEGKQP